MAYLSVIICVYNIPLFLAPDIISTFLVNGLYLCNYAFDDSFHLFAPYGTIFCFLLIFLQHIRYLNIVVISCLSIVSLTCDPNRIVSPMSITDFMLSLSSQMVKVTTGSTYVCDHKENSKKGICKFAGIECKTNHTPINWGYTQ